MLYIHHVYIYIYMISPAWKRCLFVTAFPTSLMCVYVLLYLFVSKSFAWKRCVCVLSWKQMNRQYRLSMMVALACKKTR